MTDLAVARRYMVDCQIRTNKVTDEAVIEALADIPREAFLDKRLATVAYIDEDLPIGGGRHLMEPMVFARIVQALAVRQGDVALDVGCGTGYSSAVLSRLATTVVALESDPGLAAQATRSLADLGIDNVVVVETALADGYPSQAPYDVILLGGAAPAVPDALSAQLAEGGRLCGVIDGGAGVGKATLLTRQNGAASGRELFDANIPPLPAFEPEAGFAF